MPVKPLNFSIVIPTLNESENPFLQKSLEQLLSREDLEVVWVHHQKAPLSDFLSKLEHPRLKKILCDQDSRSLRLKRGCQEAANNRILLHHPRSLIDMEVFSWLEEHEEICWGGLTHRFDHRHPLLDFTSWYSNQIRLKLKSICYLDHCLYLRRDRIDIEECFPDDVIFEDTLISHYLEKTCGPACLIPYQSLTSSKRFLKNGVLRQSLLNQVMKLAFYLKASPESMNKIYEKGLNLNNDYGKK